MMLMIDNYDSLTVPEALPGGYTVTRDDCLAIGRDSLPTALETTASSDDGEIWEYGGNYSSKGCSFTPKRARDGHDLLANVLNLH
jgi:anthranilate/para-aminobenzoate synthase component II